MTEWEKSYYPRIMETELTDNLAACAAAFAGARGLELSTIGRLAAGDSRFFSRLTEGKTFTARKYDDVIQWFSDNWPAGAEWPEGVARPAPSAAVESSQVATA